MNQCACGSVGALRYVKLRPYFDVTADVPGPVCETCYPAAEQMATMLHDTRDTQILVNIASMPYRLKKWKGEPDVSNYDHDDRRPADILGGGDARRTQWEDRPGQRPQHCEIGGAGEREHLRRAEEQEDADGREGAVAGLRTSESWWITASAPGRIQDHRGVKFSHLTVIRFKAYIPSSLKAHEWVCRCDCGAEVVKTANYISTAVRTGQLASCGCVRRSVRQPTTPDVSGQRFGIATALHREGQYFRLRCDCGETFVVDTHHLTKRPPKYVLSCGCIANGHIPPARSPRVRKKVYQARVMRDGDLTRIGSYATREEADAAQQAYIRQLKELE